MTPVVLPDADSYRLRNATVHRAHAPGTRLAWDDEGYGRADVIVGDGMIVGVEAPGGDAGVDLAGRIVFPGFVDCHTHLDKGHIWPRKPNPDGSFGGALDAVSQDAAARWSAQDVRARMEFGLRCAYAHGTVAVRTHLDSQPGQEAISWPVFEAQRDAWAGRIALQAVCLVGIEQVRDGAFFAALADRVANAGGVLGAVTYAVPDARTLIDTVFAHAAARGLDLDFHADETGDAGAATLRMIAEAKLRHGFAGRVLVGHCCSLATQPDAEAMETLDLVAKAGLSIVSLPLCNLYLQDRRGDGTTPRWRGVTLVHEMAARGIPVAFASDNTRDPFYAYGDLDMHEVYRLATRIAHLDHPVGDWPGTVTAAPAQVMGIAGGVLAPGAVADLVIFAGRSHTELQARPESRRTVVRAGRAIDAAVPDYAELDFLMER